MTEDATYKKVKDEYHFSKKDKLPVRTLLKREAEKIIKEETPEEKK